MKHCEHNTVGVVTNKVPQINPLCHMYVSVCGGMGVRVLNISISGPVRNFSLCGADSRILDLLVYWRKKELGQATGWMAEVQFPAEAWEFFLLHSVLIDLPTGNNGLLTTY
jgi:hypothetical protein